MCKSRYAMTTSKSPTSVRKSASGRSTTPTSARGRSTPAPKEPSAKKASAKKPRAREPAVTKAVTRVTKAVDAVVTRVSPPKDATIRVHDLLARFSTVMLVTSDGNGVGVHARPMAVAKLDDDCTLTFLTSVESAKVHEAKKDPLGHVIAQSRAVFLSMRGVLEVVRDRGRIHDAWSLASNLYFPRGPDDPALCLLVLHPEEAEIWDVSGARGIGYLFEAARALFSGRRPRHDGVGEPHDVIVLDAAAAPAAHAPN